MKHQDYWYTAREKWNNTFRGWGQGKNYEFPKLSRTQIMKIN